MTSTDEGAAPSSGKPSAQPPAKAPDDKHHPIKAIRETVLLLAFAILLALIVKTFFIQSFYIPSESMEPGLIDHDRILVEKPSYWGSKTPQRGDVIVFDDPGGWLPLEQTQPMSYLARGLAKIGLYPTGGHLVKRVIGVPGDVITCCNAEGQLSVNGKAIDEDGFIKSHANNPKQCDGPMIGCHWTAGPVPAGRLFVMGDNRDDSADSTVHLCKASQKNCNPLDAYVPIKDVVGKVFALAWPLNRAHWVHTPDVFKDVPDATS